MYNALAMILVQICLWWCIHNIVLDIFDIEHSTNAQYFSALPSVLLVTSSGIECNPLDIQFIATLKDMKMNYCNSLVV